MSGRKKSLSSRLSRREPDDEEFGEAIAEILHSSDRVAAIMCSALVEMELMNAIRARLVDAADHSALFHSGEASPFGTFKQKIVAGKALGIYRDGTAKDLDTIRDVRNQFAHALLKIDFENEHLAATCADLRQYVKWEEVQGRKVSATRIRFEDVCLSLSFGMMRKTANAYRDKARQELSNLSVPVNALLIENFVSASPKGAYDDVIDEMLADKF